MWFLRLPFAAQFKTRHKHRPPPPHVLGPNPYFDEPDPPCVSLVQDD